MADKKTSKKAEGAKELTKRQLRKVGRLKRAKRLRDDLDFRKALFERKSKNSAARKVAFRRRHAAKV